MKLEQNLAIRLLRVLRYNKARCERAELLMPPAKRPLFHVLPFLLHINHPDFPGYIEDPLVPYGLNNYSFRDSLANALAQVFPKQSALLANPKQFWPRHKRIESVVLMGSTGSIAQANDSDFDYWVCFEREQICGEALALLKQKIRKIERWAEQTHQLEAHFFPSDIQSVRQNDFGQADGESSGSAQAGFLKAEFFTTNIVVAGKAPFWWLMPEHTNDVQYLELVDYLQKGRSPDPKWFMDIGNASPIDNSELFGAAIWQISKAMDSPFKSVLKMAKLEVFLANRAEHKQLCNTLKGKVHRGELERGEQEGIDPYALLFDELIHYYQAMHDLDSVQLLQLCLYIKCECKLSVQPLGDEDHFKRKIIASYVRQWGWSADKIQRIDRIKYWRFYELSQISRQIYRFLFDCYKRMSTQLASENHKVNKQDMTVIGRKIDVFYSRKDHKIEYLRSAFDHELYCNAISILVDLDAPPSKRWAMYEGKQTELQTKPSKQQKLRSGNSPTNLLAWAVWNRVIDSKTQIYLGYHSDPVSEEDLYKLTVYLQRLFAPIKVSGLPREQLLAPSRVTNCLTILNFESRRQKAEIESLEIFYMTSWGELYSVSGWDALHKLRFDLCEMLPKPGTHVFVSEASTQRQRLYKQLCERSGIDFENLL